jgi:hypothetical protein
MESVRQVHDALSKGEYRPCAIPLDLEYTDWGSRPARHTSRSIVKVGYLRPVQSMDLRVLSGRGHGALPVPVLSTLSTSQFQNDAF